jgi:hypothetical protein
LQQLPHAKTQPGFAHEHAQAYTLQQLMSEHMSLQARIQICERVFLQTLSPKCESVPRARSDFACASALLLQSVL